jgi:hypothetical protein
MLPNHSSGGSSTSALQQGLAQSSCLPAYLATPPQRATQTVCHLSTQWATQTLLHVSQTPLAQPCSLGAAHLGTLTNPDTPGLV